MFPKQKLKFAHHFPNCPARYPLQIQYNCEILNLYLHTSWNINENFEAYIFTKLGFICNFKPILHYKFSNYFWLHFLVSSNFCNLFQKMVRTNSFLETVWQKMARQKWIGIDSFLADLWHFNYFLQNLKWLKFLTLVKAN